MASIDGAAFDYLGRLNVDSNGSSSEDRREDIKAIFGIKIGCKGDTVSVQVKLGRTNIVFDKQGKGTIAISFSGLYVRQGWMAPCVETPSLMNGLEEVAVSGVYTLRYFSTDGRFSLIHPTQTEMAGSPKGQDVIEMTNRAIRSAVRLPSN
jgi:hypothetical protein